ncbi:MAG: NAD(+)/NADH kinase [Acutalibacteraceae bacterium]|nr:NAD(+)/NADH kinase [Oscillospiraceae bacterium]
MKIAIKPNLTRENAFNVTQNVFSELKKLGADIVFSDEFKNELSQLGADFLPDEELYSICDIMIAIGGDGTIIHSAYKCAKHGKKILGINAGRLAFMAGIEEQELHLLKNLINGEYETDIRMMLMAQLYEDDKLVDTNYCINDVVIARGTAMRMCDIMVKCDGKPVNDYYADGIIVSTPTGSTAYALSAGGPVIDPTIESISLTPICTHSLFSRSLIFKPTSVLEVCVKNTEIGRPLLSCDGCNSIDLKEHSKIIIKKADVSAQFIRLKSDTFIDVLSQKLAQRRA